MSSGMWGQLGYTSTRGGFGVHAEEALQLSERDWLISGAYPDRTSFGQEVPMVASVEETRTFHRNLSYRYDAEVGGGCYWHSAPSGPDESGRTGNCFVHALLDRTPPGMEHQSDGGVLRPIQLWRSPSMVTPFGSQRVQAATLPRLPPEPSLAVSHEEIVRFVVDFTTDRFSPLRMLLQALVEPRSSPVILAVPTPDEGALWVATVTSLMSPMQARKLSFSVWEAPQLLTPSRLPRVELLCVSDREVPSQAAELGLPLVRAEGEQTQAEPTSELGTLWSRLAVEQLFNLPEADIVALLGQIDDVSTAVAPDPAHRAWPLAMVLARRLQGEQVAGPPASAAPHSSTSDPVAQRRAQLQVEQRAVAAGVLVRETPSTIENHQDLWRTSLTLVKEREAHLPLSELRRTIGEVAPGPLRKLLQEAYVERAALDPEWFRRVENRRRPEWSTATGDWSSPWVHEAFNSLRRDGDIVRTAVDQTLLVDFLLSQGWEAPQEWQSPPPQSSDVGHDAVCGRALLQETLNDEPVEGDEPDPARPDRMTSTPTPMISLRPLFADRAATEMYVRQLGDISDDSVHHLLSPTVIAMLHLERAGLGFGVEKSLLERILPLESVKNTEYPDLENGQGVLWAEALYRYGCSERGEEVLETLLHVLLNSQALLPRWTWKPLLDTLEPHRELLSPSRVADLLVSYEADVPLRVVLSALARAQDQQDLEELTRFAKTGYNWRDMPNSDNERMVKHLAKLVAQPSASLRPKLAENMISQLQRLAGEVRQGPPEGEISLGPGWKRYIHLLSSVAPPGTDHARLLSHISPTSDPDEDEAFEAFTLHAIGTQADLEDHVIYNAWRSMAGKARHGGGRFAFGRRDSERSSLQRMADSILTRAATEESDLKAYWRALSANVRKHHDLTEEQMEDVRVWFDKSVRGRHKSGSRSRRLGIGRREV